jgi:diguanylate cyclase (GGDEF)-like protein
MQLRVCSPFVADRRKRLQWLQLGSDPYAGLDLANARRVGGLVWALAVLLEALLFLLDVPDQAWRWGLAGALIAVSGVGALFLISCRWTPVPRGLLAANYANVVLLAVLQYLSTPTSPLGELFVLWVVFTAAVHPAHRVAPFFVVTALLAAAPLLYRPVSAATVEAILARVLVWAAMALLAIVLLRRVRSQRLELRDQARQAQEQARTDQLTGLGNRRAFEQAVGVELARAARTGRPLSIAVLDLDRLKEINDRHGHLEGDRVLFQVAEQLRVTLRLPDLSFRWGGDEFAVLFPGTSARDAERACERLAERVAARCRRPGGEPVRLAFGCAQADEDTGPAGLLARADDVLRRLKRPPPAASGVSG